MSNVSRVRRTSEESSPSSSSPSSPYTTPQGKSVFRTAFSYYKKREPRPDLSKVINTRFMKGVELTCLDPPECNLNVLGLRPLSEWRLITFPDKEGLYILPDLLTDEAHISWMRSLLKVAHAPNMTNIALHSDKPFDLITDHKALRWTTLGVQYDWETKEYPLNGEPLPEYIQSLAKIVSSVLGLGEMKPDAAIVNYYPQKATLSAHIDRSERTHEAPLISLSLGRPAVYLTGGTSLDDQVMPIMLQSGDVLVMHGPQRLVYHAVPAILPPGEMVGGWEETTTHHQVEKSEWERALCTYARTSRINLTIRQVNPSEGE